MIGSTCCATPCRRRSAPPASAPRTSSESRRTSRRPRRCPSSPTGRRSAVSRRFELRPHAYPKLWRHHAAQEQADRITSLAGARHEPWLAAVRRPDLVGVGVRKGAPDPRGGPGDLRGDRPLDRSGGLDRLAALRRRDTQRLHRRLQGDLPGWPLSLRGVSRGPQPGLRRLRQRRSWSIRCPRSAGARGASRRRRRSGRG